MTAQPPVSPGATTFKWGRSDALRKAQASLRTQLAEKGTGSFDPGDLYSLLVAGTAYSLPYAEPQVCPGRASRVLLGGRPRREPRMQDSSTIRQRQPHRHGGESGV